MSVKKVIYVVKKYVWNPATCCQMTKKRKQFQQILMKKNITCITQNFYILLAFLLITIALLIAVCFYCHLIKYREKQKTFIIISLHKQPIKKGYVFKI